MKKTTNHYVDDASLLEAIKVWQRDEKLYTGIPLSDEIGRGILAIATNLARRWNFANYTPEWKEQMIGDAIVASVRSIKNFNTELYSKPHAYLTSVCFSAFQERIKKEKKANATKYKFFVVEVMDHSDDEMSSMVDPDFYQDMINKIADFETSRYKKKDTAAIEEVLQEEPVIVPTGLSIIYGPDF